MAWDVTGLTFSSVADFSAQAGTDSITGINVAHDGLKAYVNVNDTGAGLTKVYQYTLSTANDLSTATYDSVVIDLNMTASADTEGFPTWFSSDGLNYYVALKDGVTEKVFQFVLGTAWDLSSITGGPSLEVGDATNSLDISALIGFSKYAQCMPHCDGRYYYAIIPTTGVIHRWTMSTPWDLSTASHDAATLDLTTLADGPPFSGTNVAYRMFVGSNGDEMILLGKESASEQQLWRYAFGTSYDHTTLTFTSEEPSSNQVAAEEFRFYGGYLIPTGETFFIRDQGDSQNINTYTMGTADATVTCGVSPCRLQAIVNWSYKSGGKVRKVVDSIEGLWWFGDDSGCQEVEVVIDGQQYTLLACDGSITFPRGAARAHIGLPYTTDIETLDMEAPGGRESLQGDRKKIPGATLRFYKSRMPFIGPSFEDMIEMKLRDDEDMGEPTTLLTGTKWINVPAHWNSHGRLAIRMRNAAPLTILQIVPDVEIED